MKKLLLVVTLAVIVGAGYYFYNLKTPAVPVDTAPEPAAETTSEAPVTEPATEAAAQTAGAAAEAVKDVADAAAGTVAGASTDAVADSGTDWLSVSGFDMAKVTEAIDGSDLDAAQKLLLKTGVEQAKDNPELLKLALEKVRVALGL